MCGIAGLYKFESDAGEGDLQAVRRIMSALTHRGPDGDGECRIGPVVLGHRRLSIIDLSQAGRQPMANEDGTLQVSYNGEIYNYRELRQILQSAGHHFRSETDTEVLLHGFEQWGIEGLLQRLRGMFAFGLYDQRGGANRLILARDRFGIKPLYYHRDHQYLLFGSEVRPLLQSGLIPNTTSLEALVRFLQLGAIPEPLTSVRNLLSLAAGHYALVDRSGMRIHRYWEFDPQAPSTAAAHSEESVIHSTRKLLEEVVENHLISDVPLGIFLSGGIDSSALVGLAAKLRKKPVTTLSIIFEEAEFAETRFARLVAQQNRTDHREVCLGAKDFLTQVPAIFKAMDQPTIDGVNTYFVSKAARDSGLKVVLSGVGGDEIFLGYKHFRRAHQLSACWKLFSRMPSAARRTCIALAQQAGRLAGRGALEKTSYLAEPTAQNFYLLYRSLFTPTQIQDLLSISSKEFQSFPPLIGETETSPGTLLQELNRHEFQHYLKHQLLKDTDFMSMAHSVEVRVPFLDHQLVEHVIGVPTALKLDSKVNKPLLVKALGQELPREVWDREKMGFVFPFSRWMSRFENELHNGSHPSSPLEAKAVRGVWDKFKTGRCHWSRAWAMLVAERHFG